MKLAQVYIPVKGKPHIKRHRGRWTVVGGLTDVRLETAACDFVRTLNIWTEFVTAESRLLTRGSGSDPMDKTNRILERNLALQEQLATYNAEQLAAQQAIATNTAKTTNMVATA